VFVWGKIPEQYGNMGSVEFSKFLIKEAQVAVAPGLGFGEYGDDYVRFVLIENSMRINQAVRGIRTIM
jgi:alanine-synthesizing transaminase